MVERNFYWRSSHLLLFLATLALASVVLFTENCLPEMRFSLNKTYPQMISLTENRTRMDGGPAAYSDLDPSIFSTDESEGSSGPSIEDECAHLEDANPDREACRWACIEGGDLVSDCAWSCCTHNRCGSAAQALVENGTVVHRGFSTEVWAAPWRGFGQVIFKRSISAASVGKPNRTEAEAQKEYNDLFQEHKWRELDWMGKLAGEDWVIHSDLNCVWTAYNPSDASSFPFYMVEPVVPFYTWDNHTETAQNQQQPLPWCSKIKIALQVQKIIDAMHEKEIFHPDWGGQQLGLDIHGSVRLADIDFIYAPALLHWYPAFQPHLLFQDWQCHLGLVPLDAKNCTSLGNLLEDWRLSWEREKKEVSNAQGIWGMSHKHPERLENFLQMAGFGWVFDLLPTCLSENKPYIKSFLSEKFQKQVEDGQHKCANAPYQFSRMKSWNFRPC